MTTDYHPLGQAAPVINTLTDLYTVPVGRQAIVSTLIVNNTTTSGPLVRLSVRVAGAVSTTKQFILFDNQMDSKETKIITTPITLNAGDVISVQTDTAGVAFSAFGCELY